MSELKISGPVTLTFPVLPQGTVISIRNDSTETVQVFGLPSVTIVLPQATVEKKLK